MKDLIMKMRFVFIIGFMSFQLLQAKQIVIPRDYSTIQIGIDSASKNDTIIIQAGVYYENLSITKEITIGSQFLITEDTSYITQTIVNGGQLNSTVKVLNAKATKISGLQIQNGKSANGGGISIVNSNVILDHINISENQCSAKEYVNTLGGGVYCYESKVKFLNCMIEANNSDLGAGIYCYKLLVMR